MDFYVLLFGVVRIRDGSQRNNIKFCANLGKSATETLVMFTQAFGEESLSCT
jgi:hypothetical protein